MSEPSYRFPAWFPVTRPWTGLFEAQTQPEQLPASVVRPLADVRPPEHRGASLPLAEVCP